MQARIKVKEDTLVFTIADQIEIYSNEQDKCATMLVMWAFFGGVLECGVMLGLDWRKGQRIERSRLGR